MFVWNGPAGMTSCQYVGASVAVVDVGGGPLLLVVSWRLLLYDKNCTTVSIAQTTRQAKQKNYKQ